MASKNGAAGTAANGSVPVALGDSDPCGYTNKDGPSQGSSDPVEARVLGHAEPGVLSKLKRKDAAAQVRALNKTDY